jgi:hypothetical protein
MGGLLSITSLMDSVVWTWTRAGALAGYRGTVGQLVSEHRTLQLKKND